MSFIPCSACRRRNVGYLAHCYWFAPRGDGDAFRTRQRLCEDCLDSHLTQWLSPDDAESLTCPVDGMSVEDQVFGVYVTYYPKSGGEQHGAMSLCETHFDIKLYDASVGALVLPDREQPERELGPATPHVPAAEVMRSMGRGPLSFSPVERRRISSGEQPPLPDTR